MPVYWCRIFFKFSRDLSCWPQRYSTMRAKLPLKLSVVRYYGSCNSPPLRIATDHIWDLLLVRSVNSARFRCLRSSNLSSTSDVILEFTILDLSKIEIFLFLCKRGGSALVLHCRNKKSSPGMKVLLFPKKACLSLPNIGSRNAALWLLDKTDC